MLEIFAIIFPFALFLYYIFKYFKIQIGNSSELTSKPSECQYKILYGSQTGTSKSFAKEFYQQCVARSFSAKIMNINEYDPDDLDKENSNLIIFVSTYEGGTPPDDANWFFKWVVEARDDFRMSKDHLKCLKYAVVGFGSSYYEENYNTVAKTIDEAFETLCGQRLYQLGLCDDNVIKSKYGGLDYDFDAWSTCFWLKFDPKIKKILENKTTAIETNLENDCSNGVDCCKNSEQNKVKDDCKIETCSKNIEDNKVNEDCDKESCCKNDKENVKPDEDSDFTDEDDEEDEVEPQTVLADIEDLGNDMIEKKNTKRAMLTPSLRANLQKQGYKLIGTHSGVKMCRWTKAMLRGRGGCYKHSFYGIASHQCMEATPSLACANKCVFCWRHHTNPVGTEWKWLMDEPELIVDEAVQKHCQMVKEFRGVPGVKEERLQEGFHPKHCALSLVGEPIMYPKINRICELLHSRGMSTFLVTNAQFPDAIKNLVPVTQLYVSVDAAQKDELKKIDRPLFRDFWERLLDSLKQLKEKRQRTVYRLTLVKSWNAEETGAYAKLVAIGKPHFIEVKGVTYCGDSKASNLTMNNVPYHSEVVGFVQQLVSQLDGEYEIASEHEHSNCVLVAHKNFKIEDQWHTWIDYDKFHELVKSQKDFCALDYMAPTPEWAVFGSEQRGFDPSDTRFRKQRKHL